MRGRWVWIEALSLAVLVPAILAVTWPMWSGWGPEQFLDRERLSDDAGLMSPEEADSVQRTHRYLLSDHDIDYRVETVLGVGDINLHAVARFAELDVGGLSETRRGLLLIIDAEQDLVRLEVGRSLEGVFPDAFVSYVEHRQMVPFFRDGRVADGILATTELIVDRTQNAKANAGFEGELWVAGTAGGGATTRALLGKATDGALRGRGEVRAEDTPEGTLRAYLRAMGARSADPNLDIYTTHTRKMLATWTVTPAQMDHVGRTYRRCHAEPARFDRTRRRAVIRYPVEERKCSPWFLALEEGRWRLDLGTNQQAIRFGRSNAWHFDLGVDHPYRFAFQDWTLDPHGFPR